MLSAALIFVSVVIGYTIVVGLVGATTYGLAMMKPAFAVRSHRLTATFNFLQDIIWLIVSAAGGYIVATGAAEASPQIAAAMLSVVLLVLVWKNLEEARHRGLIHMLLTSFCIVGGIAAGYSLHMYEVLSSPPPQ